MGGLPRFTLTLLAALLMALAGASQALAKSTESQQDSLSAWVESFGAALKAETARAMAAAAQAAEDGKGTLYEFKADIDARTANLQSALSEQKERFATVGRAAATAFETWRQAAVLSWAEMQRSAADALDGIADWMREQSQIDERSKIGV